VAGDGEGEGIHVGQVSAQGTKRYEELAQGPLSNARVAVEGHRPDRKGGERRHEPRHGPGVADVDRPADRPQRAWYAVDDPVLAVVGDLDAQHPQGLRHQLGVAAAQRPSDHGPAVG